MESKETKLPPKILRIIKALRVSNLGYKTELEAQVKANKELGKALDSSQEEVKRLKEEKSRMETQIKDLLMFCENDNTLVNGFMTQDIIRKLRKCI
jgi:hypothetical protein